MNPNRAPSGDCTSQIPRALTTAVVAVSAVLARVCKNGIRSVRITWMMNVCVTSDSTNQPVWKSGALPGSVQPKRNRRAANVVKSKS